MVASLLRVSARRALSHGQVRHISASPLRHNVASEASSIPLSESVRNVAERAQQAVVIEANTEGFKAGVLYTVLAGSAVTAGLLMLAPNGERDVKARDLL